MFTLRFCAVPPWNIKDRIKEGRTGREAGVEDEAEDGAIHKTQLVFSISLAMGRNLEGTSFYNNRLRIRPASGSRKAGQSLQIPLNQS